MATGSFPRRRVIGRAGLVAFGRRVAERLRTAPPALVLALLVAAATALWGYYSLQVRDWLVMTDELQFVRLAVSIGEELSLAPTIRGESSSSFSQLYPLLTAPFFGSLDLPSAAKVVHLLNVLLMASTAVPAYLLTRQVVDSRPAAYLVAALSTLVPWLALASMFRPDVVAYPVFVWACLAMQRTLVAPSVRADALALGAIVVAFLARTQFIGLAVAVPLAVAVHELGFALVRGVPRGGLRLRTAAKTALRKHVLLWAVVALALLVLAIKGPAAILGSYGGSVTNGSLLPDGLGENMARHLAIIAVATGVLPFVLALGWLAGSLARPEDRRAHAFAAMALTAGVVVAVQSSSFVIRFAGPANFDRYFFYIAPLLLVAMVACVLEGRRRWVLVGAGAVAFFLLAGSEEFSPRPNSGAFHASPAGGFNSVVDYYAGLVGVSGQTAIRWAGLALALAAALALRVRPPRQVLAAVGIVLVVFSVAQTGSVWRTMLGAQIGGPPAITGDAQRDDWIDAAVPPGAQVAILPSLMNFANTRTEDGWFSSRLWWDAELWNKRVSDAYVSNGESGGAPFSQRVVSIDSETGAIAVRGGTASYWAMASTRPDFRPEGTVVARSQFGVDLLKVRRPLRARWMLSGTRPGGWLTGPAGRLRLFSGTNEGRRAVALLLDGEQAQTGWRYELRAGRRTLEGAVSRASRPRRVRICLAPGTDRVTLRVRSTEGRTPRVRVGRVEVGPPAGCSPGGPG